MKIPNSILAVFIAGIFAVLSGGASVAWNQTQENESNIRTLTELQIEIVTKLQEISKNNEEYRARLRELERKIRRIRLSRPDESQNSQIYP